MRRAKVVVVPTLKIFKYQLRHDRASLGESRARLCRSIASVVASGAWSCWHRVGGMDTTIPAKEYALMAEAGMTFRQILASLTTAQRRSLETRAGWGEIAPGHVADLVVLRRGPVAGRPRLRGGAVHDQGRKADPCHGVQTRSEVRSLIRISRTQRMRRSRPRTGHAGDAPLVRHRTARGGHARPCYGMLVLVRERRRPGKAAGKSFFAWSNFRSSKSQSPLMPVTFQV